MFVAFLIVMFPFSSKAWVLAGVALIRSIADYRFCWEFYFPSPKLATAGEALVNAKKDAASVS
jgi:hypothetical protein